MDSVAVVYRVEKLAIIYDYMRSTKYSNCSHTYFSTGKSEILSICNLFETTTNFLILVIFCLLFLVFVLRICNTLMHKQFYKTCTCSTTKPIQKKRKTKNWFAMIYFLEKSSSFFLLFHIPIWIQTFYKESIQVFWKTQT